MESRVSSSSPQSSPSYNILAPKPWVSFKETPPSPLLVLRKREGKSPAPAPPPAPVFVFDQQETPEKTTNDVRRSLKKKQAPQPPPRTTSEIVNHEQKEEECIINNKTEEDCVTQDEEQIGSKEEVPRGSDINDKELPSDIDQDNDNDEVDGTAEELILDPAKLESSLTVRFGLDQADVNIKEEDKLDENMNEKLDEKKEVSGRRLNIRNWAHFVKCMFGVV